MARPPSAPKKSSLEEMFAEDSRINQSANNNLGSFDRKFARRSLQFSDGRHQKPIRLTSIWRSSVTIWSGLVFFFRMTKLITKPISINWHGTKSQSDPFRNVATRPIENAPWRVGEPHPVHCHNPHECKARRHYHSTADHAPGKWME